MKKSILYSVLVLVLLLTPSLIFAQQSDVDPTGSQACAIINNNLKYGTRDSSGATDISILQDFLNTKNYLTAQPTGFFGRATLIAVKAFQKDNNISPTGYVGSLTRAKIKQIDCAEATTGPVATSTNYSLAGTTTPTSTPTNVVFLQAPSAGSTDSASISTASLTDAIPLTYSKLPKVLLAGQTYSVTWSNYDAPSANYNIFLYSPSNEIKPSLTENYSSVFLGYVDAKTKNLVFKIPANMHPNTDYGLYFKNKSDNNVPVSSSRDFEIKAGPATTNPVNVVPPAPSSGTNATSTTASSTDVVSIKFSMGPFAVLRPGQTYNMTWSNYDLPSADYNVFLYNELNKITPSLTENYSSVFLGFVDSKTKNITFKVPANIHQADGYALYFKNKTDNTAPVNSSSYFNIKSI